VVAVVVGIAEMIKLTQTFVWQEYVTLKENKIDAYE
jgi:hypothetical protein